MISLALIPDPDVLPVPGPLWVFKFLLLLTFFLHMIPMNILLGGSLIAAVERLRGGPKTPAGELAATLGKMMPAVIAFTVTLGVAPLLFLQTVYGHLFYTSSVLMAWPWFMIIPILTVLYYMAYAISFKGKDLGGLGTLFAWIISLGVMWIGFTLVNNVSLSLRPESWAAIYFASPGGLNLNLQDPILPPRYLHFLVGAIAVAGLFVAYLGTRNWETDLDRARYRIRTGSLWFVVATGIELVVGFWFLFALPRETMLQFMGGSLAGTISLWLSVLTGLGAMLTLLIALPKDDPRSLIRMGISLLLMTLVGMVIARDVVRDSMLKPVFETSTLQVQPQTGVMLVFAVLLVAGIATVWWMVRRFVSD